MIRQRRAPPRTSWNAAALRRVRRHNSREFLTLCRDLRVMYSFHAANTDFFRHPVESKSDAVWDSEIIEVPTRIVDRPILLLSSRQASGTARIHQRISTGIESG
jgi:hypothetical protein